MAWDGMESIVVFDICTVRWYTDVKGKQKVKNGNGQSQKKEILVFGQVLRQ